MSGALVHGRITAAFGRQYLVEADSGDLVRCVPRGKKSLVACGDRVAFVRLSATDGVIEAAGPRSTLFLRAAAHRQKLIAANATQIAIVVAGEPSFSDELICRVLAAAARQQLDALIVLNKADLDAATAAARARLVPFAAAGYEIVEISAKRDVGALRARLTGGLTVLLGQSGMGKSTIVNALAPDAEAATREISRFLHAGRHTTTHARLYRLDDESAVIDCPGLQEFGLAFLGPGDIERGFVEIARFLGNCRFRDCRHAGEPDCAVRAAVAAGEIHPRRLELMHRILDAERAW